MTSRRYVQTFLSTPFNISSLTCGYQNIHQYIISHSATVLAFMIINLLSSRHKFTADFSVNNNQSINQSIF